eukprot:6112955-Prymnesium_polylepis.3
MQLTQEEQRLVSGSAEAVAACWPAAEQWAVEGLAHNKGTGAACIACTRARTAPAPPACGEGWECWCPCDERPRSS